MTVVKVETVVTIVTVMKVERVVTEITVVTAFNRPGVAGAVL